MGFINKKISRSSRVSLIVTCSILIQAGVCRESYSETVPDETPVINPYSLPSYPKYTVHHVPLGTSEPRFQYFPESSITRNHAYSSRNINWNGPTATIFPNSNLEGYFPNLDMQSNFAYEEEFSNNLLDIQGRKKWIKPFRFYNRRKPKPVDITVVSNDFDSLALVCRNIYTTVTMVMPTWIVKSFATALLLPNAVAGNIILKFFPSNNINLIDMLYFCLQKSKASRELFGDEPFSAVANINKGRVKGSMFFGQTIEREADPAYVSIAAHLEGLVPGEYYTFTVHRAGTVEEGCHGSGPALVNLGTSNFLASSTGKAVVVIKEGRFGLEAIVGRSLVISSATDGSVVTCATIVTNIPASGADTSLPSRQTTV